MFGNPGDIPFAGDFNGNGIDTFGLYRTTTGLVYQRDTHTPGNANRSFIYGDPGDRFMTGDWTADGTSTPGVFRPAAQTIYLRHQNSAGNADAVVGAPSSVLLPVAGFVGDMP